MRQENSIKGFINLAFNRKSPNRCLVISELVYKVFHAVDKFGDYRINIVMDFCSEYAQGHAWVSRNGKNFLISSRSIDSSLLAELGGDGKYLYFTYKRG